MTHKAKCTTKLNNRELLSKVRKMLSRKDLIRIEGDEFLLNPKVYSDSEIFNLELERIFHGLWTYVGHASEFPNPGDYKVVRVGRYPVLLVKGKDGVIRGFVNKCTHRGNILCRTFKGNAKFFKCIYHGWIFSTEGKVIGVPDREGFPSDYDFSRKNLVAVHVETYRGLIFASITPKVSLEEQLGDVKQLIDYIFNIGENVEVKGPIRYAYPGNWKLVAENTLDMYHFPVLHESVALLSEKLNNRSPQRLSNAAVGGKRLDVAFNGVGYLRGGHGFVSISREITNLREQFDAVVGETGLDNFDRQRAEFRRKATFHVYVFPNLLIHDYDNTVPTLRVISPVDVGLTEIQSYTFFPKNLRRELKRKILRAHEEVRGATGMSNADDNEIMGVIQIASTVEEPPLFLSKGLNREEKENKVLNEAGVRFEGVSNSLDDTFIRGFYKWWSNTMFGSEDK